MKKALDRNLTKLVERLEALEERAGVRLEALGAALTDCGGTGWVEVCGELHSRDGMTISSDVELQGVVYDLHGGIIGVGQTAIGAKDFFGLAVFKIDISNIPTRERPSKIRVIPQLRK